MTRLVLLITCVLSLSLATLPTHGGQVWDFADSFSVANGNPNGVWAYGYGNTSTGQFWLYDTGGSAPNGFTYWATGTGELGGVALNNPTSAGILSNGAYVDAGQATLHPGQTYPCIVRWTAPIAAWLRVDGAFMEVGGGDCDAHVVKNGSSLADGVISGFYGTPPGYSDRWGSPGWDFSTVVEVAQGDSIDFVLGVGADGGYGCGTTALEASLTELSLTTVSGYVRLDAPGSPPIAGATVSAIGTSASAVTDLGGHYSMLLLAGDYTLRASAASCALLSKAVHVPETGSVNCDFTLTQVTETTVTRIGEIRSLLEGTPVTIAAPKAVTVASGIFTDGTFYIEEPDRASGIKISRASGSPAVAEGDRIILHGSLAINSDGERVLEDSVITSKVSGEPVRPLGMTNRVARASIGADRTGLLVKVWGTVTYKSPDGAYVCIDDGSKCSNGSGSPVGLMIPIDRLAIPVSPAPEAGQSLTVTGVACWMSTASGLVRAVRPRCAGDISVTESSGSEMLTAQQWFQTYLGPNATKLPFSFTYSGSPSSTLLPTWTHTCDVVSLDSARTQVTHTYTGASGTRRVRCVGVAYNDYPVVEWTVYIKNTGTSTSSIWENIQALDAQFARSTPNEFILHHAVGSPCAANDFQPLEDIMTPGSSKTIAAGGGRSTNASLCYFNVESGGQGFIVGLGWPGQWSATFARDSGTNMRIVAGQELTRMRLYAGEEVRTPLVALQFYSGGMVRSQNAWRRWMVDHNMPRTNGEVIPPQFGGCFGNLQPSAAEECAAIQAYYDDGIKFDYYDLDAGWYIDYGGWWNVGTWEVDYSRFPNGVREVADLLHAHNTKFILWFEPERVIDGTWLAVNHPEWLFGSGSTRLFNMGNTTARNWMIDRVDSLMTSEGVDWLRNDYNIDPLGFWRGADSTDRQGISENFYVQGFLEFWDELLRRRPGLWIDTCASGGRRNDLEVLRRAVPLLRSDYAMEALSEQCHTYGISYWMPCNGTGGGLASMYDQRSCYNPLHRIGYNPLDPNRNKAMFMKSYDETVQIMPYWYGDYYPLTPYSLGTDCWMAWQFNSPEKGGGFVQAFRRDNSSVSSMQLRLSGLDPLASYVVKNLDDASTRTITGASLMSGFTVTIPTKRESAIYLYTKVR